MSLLPPLLPRLLPPLLAWLLILALALANGALREAVLVPALGPRAGLMLSGVLLCGLIAAVACAVVRREPGMGSARALGIGALWLGLTLAFEFGLGLGLQHKSWAELLAAYRFEGGNLWPLVLLFTLLAPYAALRLRRPG